MWLSIAVQKHCVVLSLIFASFLRLNLVFLKWTQHLCGHALTSTFSLFLIWNQPFWAYMLREVNILLFSKCNQHPCGWKLTWNQHFNCFCCEIICFEFIWYFFLSAPKFLLFLQIFRKYIKHRDLILEDIFASLARLPSSKRTLRSYRFAMKMDVDLFLNKISNTENNFVLMCYEYFGL